MAERLSDLHPQMLRAKGEGDRKKIAADRRVEIGRSVERAFQLAGVTKQEAAYAMGYSDPGVVSRWCSGAERPLFDKLLDVPGFEEAWIRARAERNQNIDVKTVIEIRRAS